MNIFTLNIEDLPLHMLYKLKECVEIEIQNKINKNNSLELEEAGIPIRAIKRLNQIGIFTLKQITEHRAVDIVKIDGIGGKTISEIKDILVEKNMYLDTFLNGVKKDI